MAATEEQKAILSVLLLLQRSGEQWRSFDRPAAATTAENVATGSFTPITARELERYFLHSGASGQFDFNEVVYVRPPEKEKSAVSALWCRWDFSGVAAKCGFYLGTWWRAHKAAMNAVACGGRVVFLGFRYETPEEGDNHDYFHAQPCRSMGDRDLPVVQALPITERNPSWPLAARTPLDLLLCLVASMYGRRGLWKLETEIQESAGIRAQRLLLTSVREVLNAATHPHRVVANE